MNKYAVSILSGIFRLLFAKEEINKKIYLSEESRILVVHLGTLQHALSLTPLIQVLKQSFNNSIEILTDEKISKVFSTNEDIKTVYILPGNFKSFAVFIWRLRKIKFDALVVADEYPSLFTQLTATLLRSINKIGFANSSRRILTHRIPPANSKRLHLVDRILSLTDAFEIDYEKSKLNIVYQPTKRSKLSVETYRITHDLVHKPTILINISTELEIGFWGVDSYKRLLKFLKNYNINIIIAASIDDMKEAESISDNKHLIYYNTDFDSYAALVKSSYFIFSPDSYTVQLAASYKRPVFCLFVQHNSTEMINVPYNSDFDFCLTEKPSLDKLSFGKVLNSFVPYFEYVFERYTDFN